MTHDEEMAARGRLVTDYSETQAHMTTLLHEANRLGEIHMSLGQQLKFLSQTYDKVLSIDATSQTAINNPEKIWSLVKDVENTDKRLRTLRIQVEALGLR